MAPITTVRRLWAMVAHYHGQVWSSAEPARSLGVSEPMRIAMTELKLDALFVLYPGTKRCSLADRIDVLPATAVAEFKVW